MIRILGDIHGNLQKYMRNIKSPDESIQLGDFGFLKSHQQFKRSVDSSKHKVLFGNHDDYRFVDHDHSLGHFGNYQTKDGTNIFFIRGAFSIDYIGRVIGRDLFLDEQLNQEQRLECQKLFVESKPDIVISHDCPESIAKNHLGESYRKRDQNITPVWLEKLFNQHQPKLRIYGHYHETLMSEAHGTKFACVGEHEYLDLFAESNKVKLNNSKNVYNY